MSSGPHPGSKRVPKVRQACDCCHTRKIRCDGLAPCSNCQSTDLQCTYLAVPKKKGPKGRRIRKESVPWHRKDSKGTGQVPTASHQIPTLQQNLGIHDLLQPAINLLQPPKPPTQIQPPNTSRVEEVFPELDSALPDSISPPSNISFLPSPLVTADLMTCCIHAFFTHKYPIMPVMDEETMYSLIPNLNRLPEQYSLITALCALIVPQPEIIDTSQIAGLSEDLDTSTWPSSEFLMSEAMRARQFYDCVEHPSLATVHTSFFLYAALFCIGKDNSAWFYIRESMTMLQLLRLHEETTYSNMVDQQYSTYCRRTFWLLFITERAYALQRHRPLTLQRTIALPTIDPGPEAKILSGFLDLVALFQNFDDSFLASWNLPGMDASASSQSLLQLQDILKSAIPNVAERTEIQQADLLVSQQWLKTMVWQLCVSKGLLSSSSSDESMSFHYPVSIARDVVMVSRQLPPKAFEANGVGILEKVFDIGCSLSDVLQLHPSFMRPSSLEIGPRDYLMELIRVLETAPGGSKYLRLLAAKTEDCLMMGIRGSLSESDVSDRIEEIEDDNGENMIYNGEGFMTDIPDVRQYEPTSSSFDDLDMGGGEGFTLTTDQWNQFFAPDIPDLSDAID